MSKNDRVIVAMAHGWIEEMTRSGWTELSRVGTNGYRYWIAVYRDGTVIACPC